MKRNNAIVYICVIIITLLLLSMLSIYASASFKASGFSGKISAKAAALYEPTNQSFLYTKNGDARLPMASTTKIMTAIVVAEKCRMDETVIIGPESVGIEGSSAYLREGDEYTVLELTYALLLQSANDAATALAYYVAGGDTEFADLMNAKAEMLGLENTHFTNPHGLDDEEHYTCATDLSKIATFANLCIFQNIKAIFHHCFLVVPIAWRIKCDANQLYSISHSRSHKASATFFCKSCFNAVCIIK